MSYASLTPHTISVANPSGNRDKQGKSTFSTAVDVKCRFERTSKTIINAQRELEPIHAIASCRPTTAIQKGAKVTYDSDIYRVMEVADAPDGTGDIHHREIKLQLWSF